MGACCTKEESFVGFRDTDDEEDLHHLQSRREGLQKNYEDEELDVHVGDGGALVRLKGSSKLTSMFSKQGQKGVNQDAMTIWENFTGEKGTFFCAVFDGHGPNGHKVARHVRDHLPAKLHSVHKSSQGSVINEPQGKGNVNANFDDRSDDMDDEKESGDVVHDCTKSSSSSNHRKGCSNPFFCSWKASFVKAFKKMDNELSVDSSIDSYCSGTTAVAMVKQGDELIVANLGDSRAVLFTRGSKNMLFPLQLTVDLKPNLPNEAERIKMRNGRVFALDGEPDVQRVWMPDEDCPGLAMSRAFGDFCLKDHGLTCVPQFHHHKLTGDDEFVILATDGIWDVLSNDEVMKIVATARRRSVAAKRLVESAVRVWRTKHPTSRVDDCAAVCLFLKPPPRPVPAAGTQSDVSAESSVAGSASSAQRWTGLDSTSRAGTMLNLPRYGKGPGSRSRPVKEFEDLGVHC